jgi:hypothetical protein
MALVPIFDPNAAGRPMRVAGFMSGSGTNILRLLERETFLKARGRWVTAGELAEMGLTELIESFPKGEKQKE